jgi:predicted membrane channel-forming protein YqfA (hemolysin III family)
VYKGERFNSISHLLGSVAAFAGTACLIVTAAQQGDPLPHLPLSHLTAHMERLYIIFLPKLTVRYCSFKCGYENKLPKKTSNWFAFFINQDYYRFNQSSPVYSNGTVTS